MDAGTAETFATVKGINCYDKVVSNLYKYRESEQDSNQIELKYIVLNGYNDNEKDALGFALLAKSLEAVVYISSDFAFIDKELPQKSFNCVVYLAKQLQIQGVRFSFVEEFFNPTTLKQIVKYI